MVHPTDLARGVCNYQHGADGVEKRIEVLILLLLPHLVFTEIIYHGIHFLGKLSFLAFHAIKVKLKGKVAGAQRVEHKTKSLYAFAMKNVFDE